MYILLHFFIFIYFYSNWCISFLFCTIYVHFSSLLFIIYFRAVGHVIFNLYYFLIYFENLQSVQKAEEKWTELIRLHVSFTWMLLDAFHANRNTCLSNRLCVSGQHEGSIDRKNFLAQKKKEVKVKLSGTKHQDWRQTKLHYAAVLKSPLLPLIIKSSSFW